MALKRNISTLIDKKGRESVSLELFARHAALGTWDKVAFSVNKGEFLAPHLWQVAMGKRPPTRRLLLALGIVKPEKRTGIRVRMSKDEAMALVRGQVSLALENRVRYQLWGRK